MLYLQLYNSDPGTLNTSTDMCFSGPVLGPVSSIYWNRGFIILEYAAKKYQLETTGNLDQIYYGKDTYSSWRIVTSDELYNSDIMFCGPPSSIHSVDIFSILLNN